MLDFDNRRIPLRECQHYDAKHDGECRVKHDGMRYCPQPQLPARCVSMLLVTGERGKDLWPSLKDKVFTVIVPHQPRRGDPVERQLGVKGTRDAGDAASFKEMLIRSDVGVRHFATWLTHRTGYPTTVYPLRLDRHTPDNGDGEYRAPAEVRKFEVKWLQEPYHFTSLNDWPFPDYIIGQQKSLDRMDPPPYVIVELNPRLTHAGLSFWRDHNGWWTTKLRQRHYSKKTGPNEPQYTSGAYSALFVALDETSDVSWA